MRNSLRFLLVGFAFVTGSLFALAGVASAAGDSSDAYVLSNTASRTAELPAAGTTSAASLAFTGSDALVMASVGVVAVAAGGAILIARRRVAQA